MPYNNLHIADRLTEYLSIFDNNGIGRLEEPEIYFLGKLQELNSLILKYSTRDAKTGDYKEMTAKDLDQIQKLYLSSLMLSEKVLDNDNPSKIQKKFMYITKQITKVMREDGDVILTLKAEKGLVLPALIARARAREITVNNKELATAGANSSVRIPLEYTDENGILHQGFFSEGHNMRTSEGLESRYQYLLQEKLDQGTPYRNVYENMQYSTLNKFLTTYFYTNPDEEKQKELISKYLVKTLEMEADEVQALVSDENFRKDLISFQITIKGEKNRTEKYESVKAGAGSGIETRNNAMFNVATLFGVDHLIARSENMIVKLNGKKVSGSFMDTIYGSDSAHLKENDPIAKWGSNADGDVNKLQISANALKQMSQITLLDYLCANSDRHTGNFIFHFDQSDPEHPILSSLTGIDNDLSFGEKIMKGGNSTFLDDLRYIDEAMATKICSLTKETLTFHLLGQQLSQEELDAAWDRCSKIQEYIKNGKEQYKEGDDLYTYKPNTIRVLSEDEYAKLDLKKLLEANMGGLNIYNRIAYMGTTEPVIYEQQKAAGFKDSKLTYNQGRLTRGLRQDPMAAVRKNLQDFVDILNANDPKLHKNTSVFKKFKTKLNDLLEKTNNITKEDELLEDYKQLQVLCQNYIDAKDKIPGSDYGKNRLEVARGLKALMQERQGELNDPTKAMNRRIEGKMNALRYSIQDCQNMYLLGGEASKANLENQVARIMAMHQIMKKYEMQRNENVFQQTDEEIEKTIPEMKNQPYFHALVDQILAFKLPVKKFTYQFFATVTDKIELQYMQEQEGMKKVEQNQPAFNPIQNLNQQENIILQQNPMQQENQILKI